MENKKKTVVVFNENGTVDYAFEINENSISNFVATSRMYDESLNEEVDAGYYELKNEYIY